MPEQPGPASRPVEQDPGGEPGPGADPAWAQRFRAPRLSLPDWARDRPERAVLTSNETGTTEVYAWDRATGVRRRVTDRAEGTALAAISPDGEDVYYFADTAGDEFGHWRVQPFSSGLDTAALPGVADAYPSGLELGADGQLVVGCSDDAGSRILVGTRGGATRVVYSSPEDASVGALSTDGRLLVVEHSEHGDSRHPDLRCLRLGEDGAQTVAELSDGPGRGLSALGFAPGAGDPRVLIGHERRGRAELAVWDTATGTVTELDPGIPGELSGEWYPDGPDALLIESEHEARSTLVRYPLPAGPAEPLDLPRGVIGAASARPGGGVWVTLSSAEHPPRLLGESGEVLLEPDGPAAAPSVAVRDLFVDVAGAPEPGRVHALIREPAGPAGATVFEVHGGPTAHDADRFSPHAAAFVDCGYRVVSVNYRGSTGYGSAWRDALEADIGHTELADLAAVRTALVDDGSIDPATTVLAGASWGGYLTLLGLGAQPDLWCLGIAEVPVADYVAAFADEMEGLKAFDRSLFGGTPDQVPDRYARASPITWVDAVRVPVLVTVGENDPRCPSRQVDRYLERLEARSVPHEVYRFDAGHGSLVVDERIRQCALALDFLDRHLPH